MRELSSIVPAFIVINPFLLVAISKQGCSNHNCSVFPRPLDLMHVLFSKNGSHTYSAPALANEDFAAATTGSALPPQQTAIFSILAVSPSGIKTRVLVQRLLRFRSLVRRRDAHCLPRLETVILRKRLQE